MCGGPNPQAAENPYATLGAEAGAVQQQLPNLLNVETGSTQQIGQTLQNNQNYLAPQAQSLQNQLYGAYAPQLAMIGNYLNQLTSQGGINTAQSNLSPGGGGMNLVNSALQANMAANPQYYNALNTTGGRVGDLLNSINIGGLTGSEQAQAARSFAQQDAQKGILNSPSQTAALSNAMNFGTALQNKQSLLANAIGQANNFLNQSGPGASGLNGFNIGSGLATNQPNPGSSQFLAPGNNQATNAQNLTSNTTSNLLGQAGQSSNTQQQVNAGFPSGLDNVIGGSNAAANMISAAGSAA